MRADIWTLHLPKIGRGGKTTTTTTCTHVQQQLLLLRLIVIFHQGQESPVFHIIKLNNELQIEKKSFFFNEV